MSFFRRTNLKYSSHYNHTPSCHSFGKIGQNEILANNMQCFISCANILQTGLREVV